MTKSERVVELAGEALAHDGLPSPLVSDTSPVPEGQNACEGNDCINYDFPFEMSSKGKRQRPKGS
jgi:hypothetical protein